MVSLFQIFVTYIYEQSEVSWEAEDLNWDYIIMFVLFLLKGTMKTIQIFKSVFNVGINRYQESMFLLKRFPFKLRFLFKVSLIYIYLYWWFFLKSYPMWSLVCILGYPKKRNLNGFIELLNFTRGLVLLLPVQVSRVFCNTQQLLDTMQLLFPPLHGSFFQ